MLKSFLKGVGVAALLSLSALSATAITAVEGGQSHGQNLGVQWIDVLPGAGEGISHACVPVVLTGGDMTDCIEQFVIINDALERPMYMQGTEHRLHAGQTYAAPTPVVGGTAAQSAALSALADWVANAPDEDLAKLAERLADVTGTDVRQLRQQLNALAGDVDSFGRQLGRHIDALANVAYEAGQAVGTANSALKVAQDGRRELNQAFYDLGVQGEKLHQLLERVTALEESSPAYQVGADVRALLSELQSGQYDDDVVAIFGPIIEAKLAELLDNDGLASTVRSLIDQLTALRSEFDSLAADFVTVKQLVEAAPTSEEVDAKIRKALETLMDTIGVQEGDNVHIDVDVDQVVNLALPELLAAAQDPSRAGNLDELAAAAVKRAIEAANIEDRVTRFFEGKTKAFEADMQNAVNDVEQVVEDGVAAVVAAEADALVAIMEAKATDDHRLTDLTTRVATLEGKVGVLVEQGASDCGQPCCTQTCPVAQPQPEPKVNPCASTDPCVAAPAAAQGHQSTGANVHQASGGQPPLLGANTLTLGGVPIPLLQIGRWAMFALLVLLLLGVTGAWLNGRGRNNAQQPQAAAPAQPAPLTTADITAAVAAAMPQAPAQAPQPQVVVVPTPGAPAPAAAPASAGTAGGDQGLAARVDQLDQTVQQVAANQRLVNSDDVQAAKNSLKNGNVGFNREFTFTVDSTGEQFKVKLEKTADGKAKPQTGVDRDDEFNIKTMQSWANSVAKRGGFTQAV